MRPLDLHLLASAGGVADADAMPAGAFLTRVARLAACRTVVALRDLVDGHGRVLLARGAAADAGIVERLGGHGVDPLPLDGLAAAGTADHGVLVVEAGAALEGHALLARVVAAAGGAVRVAGFLARIPLPTSLALHLAVARALHPALHRHGLLTALTCAALGLRSGQSDAACVQLAAVGLFHDVGLLHADDAVAEGCATLTPGQRRQLAAHAELSAALMRRHAAYAGAAADAVAVHHERLDGTGSPYHLHGEAIGPWGRIVAVAELLTTLDTGGGILDALRVSNLLRLQGGAFDAALVHEVLAACDEEERC